MVVIQIKKKKKKKEMQREKERREAPSGFTSHTYIHTYTHILKGFGSIIARAAESNLIPRITLRINLIGHSVVDYKQEAAFFKVSFCNLRNLKRIFRNG